MCAGHGHGPRGGANLVPAYRTFVHGEGWIGARLFTAGINVLRRGPRRAGCCGNYGEPGC